MNEVIRELPHDDRPRERMFKHGPEVLSNAELVAILLGSGMHGKNAIQLARELLKGGMHPLRVQDLRQMNAIRGMGPAKAARVAAAFEISKRIFDERPEDPPRYDATDLGRSLVTACAKLRQERLGAALLDGRHRVIGHREIFVGSVNSALVSTREILRITLADNAVALVIYHNHISGDPTPSKEDESFTKKLDESLKLADIELVDHLVIGAHSYYSMKEKGLF